MCDTTLLYPQDMPSLRVCDAVTVHHQSSHCPILIDDYAIVSTEPNHRARRLLFDAPSCCRGVGYQFLSFGHGLSPLWYY
jgi:hypothetical protein